MKKIICLLLCVLLVGALFVGCAREDAPAPAPATPAPATPGDAPPAEPPAAVGEVSQGITDTEILIGSTFVNTGAAAFFGAPIIDTIEAVFARTNAHGGIAGRQIRFIHYDDQNDPVMGRVLLERLLEEDQVFALVGISGVQAGPSLEYMRDFGAPVINITGGIAFMYEEYDPGSNIFLIQPSNAWDGATMLARAISEPLFGVNRDEYLPADVVVGLMYANSDAGRDVYNSVMALAEELGMTDRIVADVVTPETYHTVIQSMMSANVGVLLAGSMDSLGITAAMHDAEWLVPFIGAYGTSTIQSFSPATFDYRRPVYSNTWADYTTPDAVRMLADLDDALTYHPTLDDATRISYADNNFARAGYSSAITLVIGLERLAASGLDFTWENFIHVMEQEYFDLGGFGRFSFANGRRMGITELAFFEYFAYMGEDGEWVERQDTVRPFETVEQILARRPH